MSNRSPRSDENLLKASEHLAYEFWMLDSLARKLKAGVATDDSMKNAMLEALTVHARSILDFFYLPEDKRREPKPDDMLAEDYFHETRNAWCSQRPSRTPILDQVNDHVNKEIVHLNYARINMLAIMSAWPALQIRDDLFVILDAFLDKVPNNRVCERLKKVAGIGKIPDSSQVVMSPSWKTTMS